MTVKVPPAGNAYGRCTTSGGSMGFSIRTKGLLRPQTRTNHAHLVLSIRDLESSKPCGPFSPEPEIA